MSEQRISSRARLLAFPAMGAVLIGVSVAGRGSAAQEDDDEATPSASPAASPVPSVKTKFDVSAGDIYFDPKTIESAANVDVEITVTNIGSATHDFVIDALDVKTAMLSPGQSATVTINAAAGTYEYYCSVPGHRIAGMAGTLTLIDVPAEEVEEAVKRSIVAGDIYFDPRQFTIPANVDAEVTVSNIGSATHDFVIDALSVKTPMLSPGQTVTVTINAEAGTYEYYCSVPGHRVAGMAGTLTVE